MPNRDSELRYRQLLESATRMVEIAYALQDPARDDPYAPLAAKIINDANVVLQEIKAFRPRT